jgi:hypothetical protein
MRILVIAVLSACVMAQDFSLVTQPGMYVQRNGSWERLERLMLSGTKARGALGTSAMFRFSGNSAPVAVDSRRPLFCLRRNSDAKELSARALSFVRMDVKKDSREIRAAKGSQAGFDRNKTTAATVKMISDGLYSIEPSEELEPGQYMLVYSFSSTGYDFAVSGG